MQIRVKHYDRIKRMRQFAIIGMGNFGYYLAIHLYEKGHEVLAIDKRPALIQDIKDHV